MKGVLCVFTALLLAGCQGSDGTQPLKAQSNIIAGRVTMEDGSPLRGDIKDVVIGISGVSGPGERVSYTPIVKDGTYRQKVAGGQYSFSTSLFCYVLVLHQGAEFHLPLEHVGSHWNKNRDADEGIVQDFILKYTGPTPYGISEGLNIGNAHHWYGLSIGLLEGTYREDTKQSQPPIPAGTKLVFTVKPTAPAIDGSTIPPITVERVYKDRYVSLDLNDLMPASYELTGVATLPDGTTKSILLQSRGDYPKFKPAVSVPLEKADRGFHKFIVSFVME